jgi:hypothetical protein
MVAMGGLTLLLYATMSMQAQNAQATQGHAGASSFAVRAAELGRLLSDVAVCSAGLKDQVIALNQELKFVSPFDPSKALYGSGVTLDGNLKISALKVTQISANLAPATDTKNKFLVEATLLAELPSGAPLRPRNYLFTVRTDDATGEEKVIDCGSSAETKVDDLLPLLTASITTQNTTESACVSESGMSTDLNGDGKVDSQDVGVLINLWGQAKLEFDYNGDGIIGAADLAMLLGTYGTCNP